MSVPNPMKGHSGFTITVSGGGGGCGGSGGAGGSGYATTIASPNQSMGVGQTQTPMPDGMWLYILLLEVRAYWTFRFLPRPLRDRIIAALNGDTP